MAVGGMVGAVVVSVEGGIIVFVGGSDSWVVPGSVPAEKTNPPAISTPIETMSEKNNFIGIHYTIPIPAINRLFFVFPETCFSSCKVCHQGVLQQKLRLPESLDEPGHFHTILGW